VLQIKKINYLLPFKKEDIFFTVGVGYNEHIYEVIEDSKKKTENFKIYTCVLLASDLNNGIFKINIERLNI